MNDFLSIAGSSPDELNRVLHLASAAKLRPGRYGSALAGKSVGLFFMKPSTRTRVSSEVAALQLGAHPIVLKDSEVGLGGRETVEDVARVLDRYLDVLALRVFGHGDLVTMADEANAPVINLLSDREHPCQAVADLQTLAEVRPLEGAQLAFVGDGNNVCHSLMVAGAMVGVEMRIATPPGFEPEESFVEIARRYGSVTVTNDVHEAVRSADAVYTDVWTSMGQEEEKARRLAAFSGYQINETLFAEAAPDAVFLHCLPAHRGEEVSAGVMEHERSRVFDQAENRMHAFKGILLALFE